MVVEKIYNQQQKQKKLITKIVTIGKFRYWAEDDVSVFRYWAEDDCSKIISIIRKIRLATTIT